MKLNKKRFWQIAIPIILLLAWIGYYVNNYYPVEHILRIGRKAAELKDVKAERITVQQAKDIIILRSPSVSIKEVTTDEVFNKMGYQIFKNSDCETYVIKDKKTYKIGKGPGGWGVMDFCVTDLNKDSVPELIYTYSWGSGYHRTEIGMLVLGEEDEEIVATRDCNGDLFLDKVDNQCVVLKWDISGYNHGYLDSYYYLYNGKLQGKILGTLFLKTTEDTNILDVKLRRNLPLDERRVGYMKKVAQ